MIYYAAMIFFFVSFAYAWGSLKLFRDNFLWSAQSVVGITFTISLAYIVWIHLQQLSFISPNQVWLDLFILFVSALPGQGYLNWKQIEIDKIKFDLTNSKILKLSEELKIQKDIKKKLDKILENQEKQSNEEVLEQVKGVLFWREQYYKNYHKQIILN